MRSFFIATLIAMAALLYSGGAPAFALQKSPESLAEFMAAMSKYTRAEDTRLTRATFGRGVVRFCGQCTDHPDCGTERCCETSTNCWECKNVTECPKKTK